MKILSIGSFVFLLSGCFIYSSKDDCIYGLTSTQCFGEVYSSIARYQKPYSLGKTNAVQRRKDIESCGGFFSKDDPIDYGIKGSRDKNGKSILQVVEDFRSCMKNKGYIYFSNAECGRKNSKTDKGICNE
ncbi:hypothetical protein [Glaesserella parasuis]|uniref:hypothetical protein n=1 Tax=Glaesserella parasuis TaxID=738 RepID=UPI0024371D52|nr:hypothetical protein [Glaesserella parasuis]MDG6448539.1 hypothetical protein [Glaesserella parasuis]MDG6476352.1 hypothetical protein [Glaesserella parasuis]